MIPRFFGNSSHPLFGCFHPPRGRNADPRTVVICPPVGHEYVRTHWALRSLATKLARTGCSVLRFDYRGTGDSSGDVSEVASVDEWIEDACEAGVELLEESGQMTRSMTLVGLRWGAAIACMAATELAESHSLSTEIVLWDPCIVGAEYLNELRSIHNEMLDLWVDPVETEDSSEVEELLGFRYQRSLISEIESINLLTGPTPPAQQVTVFNSPRSIDLSGWQLPETVSRSTGDGYDWDDLRYIEEAWLPGNGSSLVCEAVASAGDGASKRRGTQGVTSERSPA